MSVEQEIAQMTERPEPDQSSWERIALFVLLLMLFAFGIFDHSLWSSNDAEEGVMIADMYRSGTWVTPLLNGQNYPGNTPLFHWTSLFFCHIFGRINEGLVRLPAAIFGFGAVLIAYLWGCKLGREKAGMAGAFMCGTSILYLEYSKAVLTVMALTFMIMLSLYLFWTAYTAQKARAIKYFIFLIVSALSFYAKGLLGPAFIWVSISIFLLYNKRWKLLLGLGFLFLPLFLMILAPWVWALWKTGGTDFLKTVFRANQFGHYFTFNIQNLPKDPCFVHKEPIYFYIKSLPLSLMPWTLLIPPALLFWFRRERGLNSPLHIFLRIILISMLIILHASSAKVSCYALLMFPILFLMTAIWGEDAIADRNSRIGHQAIAITTGSITLLNLLVPITYVLLLVMPQSIFDRYFNGVDIIRITGTQSTYAGLIMAIVSVILLAISIVELWRKYIEGAYAKAWLKFPAIMTLLLILNAEMIMPAYDYQRTVKPFARLVRFEKEQGIQIALATQEEQYIGAFTFYLKGRLPIVRSVDEVKNFLFSGSTPAGIIVRTRELNKWLESFPESKFQILKSDHKGYQCDDFRIIVHNPKTSKTPSHSKTKEMQPSVPIHGKQL
jgi:4-amino-4-deoxy-L-arabinose transferase-like glycosyltransferase